MKGTCAIRGGGPGDAPACAAIFNDWVDATPWMPRMHSAEEVVAYYYDHLFKTCRMLVAGGESVRGFLALDEATGFVLALYLSAKARGQGIGRALLDRAKTLRPVGLSLWAFVANTSARRFYKREGFKEVRRTDGDNEEGLPDVLYGWSA